MCVSASFPAMAFLGRESAACFCWAPQVLPLIGRLISNLVTCACKGRRCPKGLLCLGVPDKPCLIHVFPAHMCRPSHPIFQKSNSCRLIALCLVFVVGKAACKPSTLALCPGELGVKSVSVVGVMSWTSSASPRQEG